MSRKKVQLSSIGEKINELLAPKELLDPEYNSDDETVAKARYYDSEDEHLPTAQLSHIRKKNVRMLQDVDAKYSGKISSRTELDMSSGYEESSDSEVETGDFSIKLKELESDDGSEDDEVDSDNDNVVNSVSKNVELNSAGEDDEEEENGSEDSHNSDEDEDDEGSSIDDDESDFDGGDIMPDKPIGVADEKDGNNETDEEEEVQKDDEKQSQIKKDVEKGLSIQNQLHIWEKLLEIRIHSQKILLKANSLPQANHFQQLTSHPEFNDAVQKTSTNVENLLTKMCTLQKALINQYPETKEINAKRRRVDVTDESDRVSKVAKKLESDHVDFKEYRNSTISKWYDRTKVLTPGASKNLKQPAFDIIRNIEGALSNRDELIKKTQLFRGGYEIIGMDTTAKETLNTNSTNNSTGESEPVICTEIYDDTDFYHSQLRELIEFKANTSTNPADMAKQFVELQKLRNKIKKVVDTRASKGRKIRYAVHNKMVNFMARNDPSEWSNEAKTELFSSLFGSRSG